MAFSRFGWVDFLAKRNAGKACSAIGLAHGQRQKGKAVYKIEVQEDNGLWHDIRGADGNILTFAAETEARAELETRYPVLVQLEHYAGPKRTRVLTIWADEPDGDSRS